MHVWTIEGDIRTCTQRKFMHSITGSKGKGRYIIIYVQNLNLSGQTTKVCRIIYPPPPTFPRFCSRDHKNKHVSTIPIDIFQ